ncbi:hypothetical protein NNC19_02090 [Clostridium sp. SHJSY1]|uniref:hypothetical protein n=1 Tax=Clostridium sp. SHJSY1 TaxID=2942483 RepID=UPI00287492C8|nr:hypothetical protein [Clostridium sp. SHJSY1]MDS0524450.1 hypothetical protein [Clostridium sp. SHJSY1]
MSKCCCRPVNSCCNVNRNNCCGGGFGQSPFGNCGGVFPLIWLMLIFGGFGMGGFGGCGGFRGGWF